LNKEDFNLNNSNIKLKYENMKNMGKQDISSNLKYKYKEDYDDKVNHTNVSKNNESIKKIISYYDEKPVNLDEITEYNCNDNLNINDYDRFTSNTKNDNNFVSFTTNAVTLPETITKDHNSKCSK